MKYYLLFIAFVLSCGACTNKVTTIDLAGQWQFKSDSLDLGIGDRWFENPLQESITLPGTTDQARFGVPNALKPELEKPQVLHLTRKNAYIGPAWYRREVEIPADWTQKRIELKLERVIWNSRVWVNDHEVGEQESLIAPHYFDLTSYLKPGKNTITIRIDNRKQHEISVKDLAHAYTNDTQIMWNGILGQICLNAYDPVAVDEIQVYPDVDANNLKVVTSLLNTGKDAVEGKLTLRVLEKSTGRQLPDVSVSYTMAAGTGKVEANYPMGDEVKLWSEFTPELYQLNATWTSADVVSAKTVDFGMRKFTNRDAQFQINGQRTFMRGTLECCIFPLTGTPPMDKEGWKKVFGTAREWGLNHIRFHSWCPPQAAFQVADELGFYIQVELPLWWLGVGEDESTTDFLKAEAQRIIREYGNHPSFCFWSMGNELEGNFDLLSQFVSSLKEQDPRHLYMNTTFTFQKGHGAWPESNDDFFVTQWTDKGWVRGQGIFNSEPPCFNKDYRVAVEGMKVPLITHEIGQYSVYPNMEEIEKYTGVLEPLNFKAVKNDLQAKGLLEEAGNYLMASGKLAALLYKEEIERAMKTDGCSGFQLLDLHDFPGQGTALVGLLDAFWESKGVISADEFRQFCAPVVPLVRFPKAVYENNETFEAVAELANFGAEKLDGKKMLWELSDTSRQALGSGEFILGSLNPGNNQNLGTISVPLSGLTKASQLLLTLKVEGTTYHNSWKIWVYPAKSEVEQGKVIITRDAVVAEKALEAGKNVLYNPDWRTLEGIEGKFLPVFWSPVHFPKQAATMGVLCDPNHPALADFPTEMHTDWQWWELNINSTTLILDSLPRVTPIVGMVDNWVNNRRLASVFEAKAGKGRLMFSSIDLSTDLEHRPVARQLLTSLLKYMNSEAFQPGKEISFKDVKGFTKGKINGGKLSAESIY